MTDNDPLGLQEWQHQKWAIFKRRTFRYGFWPFCVGLVIAAWAFLKKLWGWVGKGG